MRLSLPLARKVNDELGRQRTHDDHRSNRASRGIVAHHGSAQATSLVVGTTIGVGIFNVPASLASYGPISLVAMALTTVGALCLVLLFASVSRRMPADGGPTRTPAPLSATRSGSPTPGCTGSPTP